MPSPIVSGLEVSHMFHPHPRGEEYTRGHLKVCPPQCVIQHHWEFDGASLFPAEDRCPVQSDLGETETGGRQPSGRTEAKEPDVGSVIRRILAPACKPCAISLTSSLLAWSSQWEAVTST